MDYANLSDEQLMDLVRDLPRPANEAPFAELYRRWFWRLVAYFRRMGCRHHDAEDLAQETMWRVSEHRLQWNGDNFPAWLFAIAHNLLVDWFRRETSHAAFLKRITKRLRDRLRQLGSHADVIGLPSADPFLEREAAAVLLAEYHRRRPLPKPHRQILREWMWPSGELKFQPMIASELEDRLTTPLPPGETPSLGLSAYLVEGYQAPQSMMAVSRIVKLHYFKVVRPICNRYRADVEARFLE
jgi:RNA polymerase sigma factor (sigma-70 family)